MISDDVLLATAVELTGLDDFGGSDQFRVGLRVLIEAVESACLPEQTRQALEVAWVENLVSRLRLVDHRRRHPAIAEEPIAGPLAVIGLPRTGTSALVDLLVQDPASRALLQWETKNLFPPADKETWADDPRIAAMERELATASETNPVAALGLHTWGATLPDECNSLLTLEFWTPNLAASALLPKYVEWLRLSRPERPYLSHRWILQQLQAHGRSGRWTLKSPFHCFAPAALLAEYPDAMLVQTHRDPAELLASNAGLLSTIRGFGPGDVRRLATGQEQAALWGTGLQRCLAERADPAVNSRVLDISHHAVIRDPLGTVRGIYEHFDLPFSAEAEGRMKAWLERPAQHQSSVRFSLSDFGLSEDEVENSFGPYRSRFAEYF